MNRPLVAPYGTWKSPVSLEMVAHGTINLLRIVLDGPDTYRAEVRPAEDGHTVIVKRAPDDEAQDIIPPGFGSVLIVDEYGARQRVHRLGPGELSAPITPEGNFRYGSKMPDRKRARISASVKIAPTRTRAILSAKS